ncbi:polyprotein [Plakobranchus ocellatus]|uniref:Polyprotein n=1 Tax=Plakobranchus ocellatus TaxID=259542 RepID=A0AAV4DIL1_9GAST|nr:polyprotein [Plakobranchus ocellatus]
MLYNNILFFSLALHTCEAGSYGKIGTADPFVPEGSDDMTYSDTTNGVYIQRGWDNVNNRFFFTASLHFFTSLDHQNKSIIVQANKDWA